MWKLIVFSFMFVFGAVIAQGTVVQLPNGGTLDINQWINDIINGMPGRFVTSERPTTVGPNVTSTSTAVPGDGLDLTLYPGEECLRTCSERRVCYFRFTMEHYQAMGAACKRCAQGVIEDCFNHACISVNGVERGVMSINRQIPGPPIHVCKDDLVVIDVTNRMAGTAATLHWHGFHHRDTPYMDGVPFVTQCPIDFATTFRYAFWATEPGTQFYHSHTGHHKVNGHFGGFIVRDRDGKDPNAGLYDEDLPEHMMVVSDWMHEDGEMYMPGNPTRGQGIQPNSLLINGKGQHINSVTNERNKVPLAVFRVRQGRKYRFRFINSASHVCPFILQFEKHPLTVIASDSYSTRPIPIDSLFSESGERYDFVVDANQTEGDYWIRMRAVGPCNGRNLEQFAILTYSWNHEDRNLASIANPTRDRPLFSEPYAKGRTLNNPNATCYDNTDDDFCVVDMQGHTRNTQITHGMPDYRYFLGFDNYRVDTPLVYRPDNYDYHFMNTRDDVVLVGAINNITFNFPSFSLLTQTEQIDEDMFCNSTHKPAMCDELQICPCIHRIKIPLGALVELIIVDETEFIRELNHPFHLHGFPLHVVGMGQHPQGIPMTVRLAQTMYRTKGLPMAALNSSPPLKDTVSVPSRGYTVVRFRADNPGFWLMHCHFEWHMAVGMGLVLQVGDPAEMVRPPPNFPKCGNYLPDIDASVLDSNDV